MLLERVVVKDGTDSRLILIGFNRESRTCVFYAVYRDGNRHGKRAPAAVGHFYR